VHLAQYVALQVDARRNLDQLQPARVGQAQYAAFGDIQDALAAAAGFPATEGAVLDLTDELAHRAFAGDANLAAFELHRQVASREGADEHHGLGVLADVDEAAGAGQARTELADVEVALGIRLSEPQHGQVQAAAVVEVELVRLVDHRLAVDGGAEAQAAGRNAA